MAKITTSAWERTNDNSSSADYTISVTWSWPTVGAYQHIQINNAYWHTSSSGYFRIWSDSGHSNMIGGRDSSHTNWTSNAISINTNTTRATCYGRLKAGVWGKCWFVIDYDIINDVPPSTLTAGNVTAGQTSTVSIANTTGLGSVKHTTTWSIGSYSHSEDTAINVDTASYTIPGAWQAAFSGTTGTMTITLATYLNSDSSLVGSNSTTVTLTRDRNYDVEASTVTTAAATGGQQNTVQLANAWAEYAYHTVTWAIGNYSHTETTALGATSSSYTIPTSWCEAFPSAGSGTMTVTVQTYNSYDEACGSAVVKSVTLSVPTYTPTISAAAVGTDLSWNCYVQNRSKTTITITASGMYGSTITSYRIAGHNLSVTAASGTSDVLNNTGTLDYTCTVTDSRGMTATTTVSILVYAYAAPVITTAQAYRCEPATYDAQSDGTRGAYVFDYSYSTVGGNNTCTASIELQLAGTTITTISQPTLGQADLLYANLQTTRSYMAIFTVTDGLGSTSSIQVQIPTAEVYMYLSKTLNSIGIGVYPQHANSLELGNGYHLYINDVEITS